MSVFLIRRVLQSVAVLFAMSLIVFAGVFVIGDPVLVMISPEASQADVAATRAMLGLDQPLWVQYGRFIGHALSGDLGRSYAYSSPALRLILERMPATMELAVTALVIAVVVGIPLGLWAGLKPDSLAGRTIMTGSILGFSLPTFWVGVMLIMLFSVALGWLPASGRGATVDVFGIRLSVFTIDGWKHLLLPALNLALFKLALVIRLVRAGTREAMLTDYVRYARAKGLSNARIVGVHVLKNILIPIVTVLGLEFGSVIAFSIVTESIFAWPGMGKLIIDSIGVLDRPVIVAYLLVVVTVFIVVNLVVDVVYSLLDPRVRLTETGAAA
jgi:peptide/nickel transport system permease protein